MPKPTTRIDLEASQVPFYYVRVPPMTLRDVEAKRLALGYNKTKAVEVMAGLFLKLEYPGTPTVPAASTKKKSTRKPKK